MSIATSAGASKEFFLFSNGVKAVKSINTVAALGAMTGAFLIACGGEPGVDGSSEPADGTEATNVTSEELTYDEFSSQLTPAEDGVFYQGDIYIPNSYGTRAFWETFLAPHTDVSASQDATLGSTRQALSAYSSLQSLRSLTYCIRFTDDPALLAADPTYMNSLAAYATWLKLTEAADMWAAHTNTTYTYVEEKSQCDATNTRVTFHVRLMNSTEMQNSPNTAASAFFPGYERSQRVIKIRPDQIANSDKYRGLLLHELGHTLGFVHEQYRDQTTGCGDLDNAGTPLTRYDSSSIMHYSMCNGTGSGTTLSTYDVRGADCAYLGQCEWERMPGEAIDIGVGANGDVWIVGSNNGIYKWISSSTSWQQMAGSNGFRITVAVDGTPWLVTTSLNIYRWNGSSWTKMPGQAYDIAAGGTSSSPAVWIIGTNGRMYRWDPVQKAWVIKSSGSNGLRIAVDNTGKPWIVNSDANIYVENGNGWLQLPGQARDIGAGADGSVWIIGNTSKSGGAGIYEFQPSSGGTTSPDWIEVTGAGTDIAVGPSGKPWIVNSVASIYRNRWE